MPTTSTEVLDALRPIIDPDFQKSYDTVSVEMPTGSIAFVLGTTYHGAGTNNSKKDRVAVVE